MSQRDCRFIISGGGEVYFNRRSFSAGAWPEGQFALVVCLLFNIMVH